MARSVRDLPAAEVDTRNAAALVALGRRVRERRRRLGLTLREVATGTGLSVPFLSQVENGVGTPSLSSLFALARELDTVPEAFLAGPSREDIAVIPAGGGVLYPYSDRDQRAVRRQLTGEGEPFSAAEYIVEPGGDLGDFQASDGRELLHVVTGRLLVEIRVAGEVRAQTLGPGDTIVYSTSEEHRWSVVGTKPTRFVHVVSPTR